MSRCRTISPVWFWVVSGGLHATAFVALWGVSMFGYLDADDYDTAPRLSGSTSASAAHRSSSLGDITNGEGRICLEPVVSSIEERVVVALQSPTVAQDTASAAVAMSRIDPPQSARRASIAEASAHARTVQRQKASLPSRTAENLEIARHFASVAPVPHVLPRAKASVVEAPPVDLPPAAFPRLPAVAAVLPKMGTVEVTAAPSEVAGTSGGRFIRRTGHVGRNGSVGNETSPEPLANRPPVYPEVARQNNWDGTVLLRLRISEQGHVERVEVATSSGHEVLDEAAVLAVREWGFRPAQRASRGVAATVLLPIVFDLRGTARLSEFSTLMSK